MITLKGHVNVHPKYFSVNQYNAALQILREKHTQKCTKEHGFIIDVFCISKLSTGIISYVTGNIMYKLNYTVKTFLPEMGTECDGKIIMIISYGMLLHIHNFIGVVVKYNKNVVFIDTAHVAINGKKYTIGTIVPIRLLKVIFVDNVYKCEEAEIILNKL